MRTPITYYGGKQHLVKELLSLVPEHCLYVEAFTGGAALFFAKVPSQAEVINDLNGEIANFYSVSKNQFGDLKAKIDCTLHSRSAYKEAQKVYNFPSDHDPITRAWAFWVCTNQGFSGKIGSWAMEKKDNKVGRTLAGKRDGFTPAYAERLRSTQIENADALKIIRQYDTQETFFYLDPPYFNSDCGHYKGYTEEDYIKLLKVLSQIKGKFLLSSYPSETLTRFSDVNGWNYYEKQQKVSVTHKSKKQKTEVMVFNYDPPAEKKEITNKECKLILEKYGDKYKLKEVKRIKNLLEQVAILEF